MKHLMNPSENAAMIARIESLSPSAKPLWGKMSAAQMCAHAGVALRGAFGELDEKRGLLGFLLGPIAKKQILGERPFRKNSPTAKSFVIMDDRELERERSALIEQVKRFSEHGSALVGRKAHVFFGPMSVAEWDHLMWKHLDHHLRQFGV